MIYTFKHGRLDTSERAVMGILNLSPDSFFDGGKLKNTQEIIQRVREMNLHGMKILDIGGQSSRPGSVMLPADAELERIMEVFPIIRREFPELLLSIDTFHSFVAEWSLQQGADIINDISGGTADKRMMKTVARHNAGYILMHMKGTPANMQDDPVYDDVVSEVSRFLLKQVNEARSAGITKLFTDPGFGFGKTLEHNYALLNALQDMKCDDLPMVCGFSRKSMINKVLGTTPATALNGTTVLNTMALMRGANILRVHDVKEASEVIKICNFTR